VLGASSLNSSVPRRDSTFVGRGDGFHCFAGNLRLRGDNRHCQRAARHGENSSVHGRGSP